MNRFISVDCGKADTKTSVLLTLGNSIARSSFPTRVIEKPNKSCLESVNGTGETGFIVEYDGRVFAVGDIANSDDSFTSNQNSKNDITHKIATLVAISRSVNNDDAVKVVIGCPIELYSNTTNREKYLNSILPSGRIDITVNGISKHFTIIKKLVLPESLGILYSNRGLFEDKLVGIIDIGGLNVNAAIIDNLRLVSNSCFTEKLGRRAIENEIRQYANDTYESSFSTTEINAFIRQGYITDNFDPARENTSRQFIDKSLGNHVVNIVRACSKHGWNLRNMNLVFIGGGSILLKDKIMSAFPNATVVENAAFANSDGFLINLCFTERMLTEG